MGNVQIDDTGVLFRNPKAHVNSIHAYFPSVVYLGNNEFLASVVLGEAFESTDLWTHLFRSIDGGQNWVNEGALCTWPEKGLRSNAARLTLTPEGHIIAFVMQHDRTDHPNEGLTNSETLGFVPTSMILMRSRNKGETWGAHQVIDPPLVGPSFELCSPITCLKDGRWLIPTSTWQGWEGDCPNGIRMIALESQDQGESWPTYYDVMHEPDRKTYYWESKIVELPDNRLLSVAWVHDAEQGADRNNHYALSLDGGKSWSQPMDFNIQGQTMTPHVLKDGRVILVYRRIDSPGLWATLGNFDDTSWVHEPDIPIWGTHIQGLTGNSTNMVDNFTVLRFGAPCITSIDDETLLITFWCYEDCVSVIRWYRLHIK